MTEAAGFSFSNVVIVASLEPHEFTSGKHLRDYVETQARTFCVDTPVELLTVAHRFEFLDVVTSLCERAHNGERPLLHVECHGDPSTGLEFENGSTLAWEELSECMERLNRATGLNLFAVCSACYGAHFATQHIPIGGAPCYALIAPTEKIDPGEALGHFRTFYTTLFRTRDAASATAALVKQKLSEGSWFWLLAELWFVVVSKQYVETMCGWETMLGRAKEARMRLPLHLRPGTARMLRFIRKANANGLDEGFFAKFFMIEALPANADRFRELQVKLDAVVRELRATGRYAL